MRPYAVAGLFVLSLAMTACGGHTTAVPPAAPYGNGPILPFVQERGGGSSWVTFKPSTNSTAAYAYDGLVSAPSGKNLWFQDTLGNGIVRMSLTGTITEFTAPGTESNAGAGMAAGSDGRFYFGTVDTANSNCSGGCGAVAAMSSTGVASMYDIGTSDANNDVPAGGFVKGADGNVWFTEFHHIGKITHTGAITQFAYSQNVEPEPGDITLGGDGNIWFTLGGAGINPSWLGKLVPSTGIMTFFNLTSLVGCSFDDALTAANDGNVWVDCGTKIVRVTPAGVATAFTPPANADPGEISGDMTRGAGNTIWWGGAFDSGHIVQYDTVANTYSVHFPPSGSINNPRTTIVGPDGNVWFAAQFPGSPSRMEIAVYVLDPIKVTPASISLTGNGSTQTLTVSQTGASQWTYGSSNRNVATVAQGSSADQFVVTAVGPGTCKVTIGDVAGGSTSDTDVVTVTVH